MNPIPINYGMATILLTEVYVGNPDYVELLYHCDEADEAIEFHEYVSELGLRVEPSLPYLKESGMRLVRVQVKSDRERMILKLVS